MPDKHVNYLQEISFIIFSQKKVFLAVASTIFLAFLAYAVLAPPVYMAQGSFFLKGKKVERSPDQMESVVLRPERTSTEDLYSEVEMLASEDVLRATVLYLARKSLLSISLTGSQEEREQTVLKWISSIRGSLQTEVVPKSNVIQVKFFWPAPVDAQNILEAVMMKYLEYRENLLNPAEKGVFFSERVDEYLKGLKASKAAMIKLYKDNAAFDPLKEIENNLLVRQTWLQRLQEVQTRFQENEKALARMDKALSSGDLQLFTFVKNPSIELLGTSLQKLLDEKATISKTFQEDSVPVKVVNEHVRTAFDLLKREVQLQRDELSDKLVTDEEQIKQLQEKIQDIDARNGTLRRVEIETQEIQRENELISISYKTFYQRREETSIGKNLNPEQVSINSYVVVLSKAKASMSPVQPRRIFVTVFGLFVSLLLGFLSGLANNYLDRTFKRQSDVSAFLGLPLIFSMSDVQRDDDKPVGKNKNTPSFLRKTEKLVAAGTPTLVGFVLMIAVTAFVGGAWTQSGTAPHGDLATVLAPRNVTTPYPNRSVAMPSTETTKTVLAERTSVPAVTARKVGNNEFRRLLASPPPEPPMEAMMGLQTEVLEQQMEVKKPHPRTQVNKLRASKKAHRPTQPKHLLAAVPIIDLTSK